MNSTELTPETIPIYNGWQNKPTWLVALWIDNSEYSQHAILERMKTIMQEHEKDSWIIQAAQSIKEFIEEPIEELENASLLSDLIGWALAYVEYEDLARGYLDQAQEE